MIRDDDQVRFSILGDGPLKERLIRKARDLKIEGDVDFLSPTSDVFSYYQLLDLYLNTSHHEGIPLTILEAMACGKPVVAPSVGGVPEIVSHGEHGLLVEGREPRKFADSCLKLIQNKDLRITMGETASKRIVSCFDSFKMAECYRQLYRQSCKKF
jgi:glycosyltransferase involved in cell wall biosynthesis